MGKDEAAAAMARKRWKGTTKAERVAVAKKLAEARWGKAKKKGKPNA